MRPVFAVIALATLIASATAQVQNNQLRLFFTDTPNNPTAGANPVLDLGETRQLTLIAEIYDDRAADRDNWVGIALQLDPASAGNVSNVDTSANDIPGFPGLNRWDAIDDAGFANGLFSFLAVTQFGTGFALDEGLPATPTSRYLSLATFDFEAGPTPAVIRGTVDNRLFGQSLDTGGSIDSSNVIFGFGTDESLDGGVVGASNDFPMITITPEPQSLLLLTLAGVGLLRRH